MIQNIAIAVLALSVAVYASLAASPVETRRDKSPDIAIGNAGASTIGKPNTVQEEPTCSPSPTPGG